MAGSSSSAKERQLPVVFCNVLLVMLTEPVNPRLCSMRRHQLESPPIHRHCVGATNGSVGNVVLLQVAFADLNVLYMAAARQ